MQISLEFMETNCPAFICILSLFEDILGDLTRLFYLTCFAVIIVRFHRWQKSVNYVI